jgi:hypothetical protein
MIYNKDYLFIHIPRSAGKCIKSSIIPLMQKPIYFAQKHIDKKFFNQNDFILINPSSVHISLEEIDFLKNFKNAQEIKDKRLSDMFIENQYVPDLKQIKNIIICLRNPLDRAKSLYKYEFFKRDYRADFETFTEKLVQQKAKFFSPTKHYCTINNELPDNIKFIRFDFLEEDLCKLFNVNKIDVQSKKHNQIHKLNESEKHTFFKFKDVNKVISNINTWEEWVIQKGLLNAVTEKDFII